MSVFAGLGNAKFYGNSNWVRGGSYRARLVKATQGISERPERKGAPQAIMEFSIDEVIVAHDDSHKVGETCSHFNDLRKSPALGNVRNFVEVVAEVLVQDVEDALAAGRSPRWLTLETLQDLQGQEDPIQAIADYVFGADGQRCAGVEVRIDATTVERPGKGPFTKVVYSVP